MTDDNEEMCPYCDGTGEGQYDGSTCWHCGGSGVVRSATDEEDRAEFLEDR